MNANCGYSGWSMSNNAVQAYQDGEMPKSKWTKAAMIGAIREYCLRFDLLYDEGVIKGLRKDDLFDRFFYRSSWHHTSKFFNVTDFYSLNEDAVASSFPPLARD